MAKRPRRILRRRWATTEGWRATPAGMWAWLAQRAAAVALLAVIVLHLRNPFWRPVQATLLGLVLLHGLLGVRAIVLDFGLPVRWHRALLAGALVLGAVIFAAFWGVAMVLKVFRWSPGFRERLQRFWVPAKEGMTVLDALVDAQRRLDPTLAFRYACRVGMCGSCAMVVNGRERWACRTLLASLKTAIVTVRPLYHFPLVRDLVVDMAPLAEQTARVGGAFVPAAGPPTAARIGRDAAERRRIDPAIECIGCGMCMSACTMVANDPRFPGPAALNRLFTLEEDSRDVGHAERAAVLLSEDALTRCHTQANCTAVCPMEISPTQSILALRRRAARHLLA